MTAKTESDANIVYDMKLMSNYPQNNICEKKKRIWLPKAKMVYECLENSGCGQV